MAMANILPTIKSVQSNQSNVARKPKVSQSAVPDAPQFTMFINASPVAVYSVLADLEHRPQILRSVKRTKTLTPLPVGKGTLFVEQNVSIFQTFQQQFQIGAFSPPDRIELTRKKMGCQLRADIKLCQDNEGTRLTTTVTSPNSGYARWIARWFARHWAGELEQQLNDIKRYVEPRANPTWQAKLRPKNQ